MPSANNTSNSSNIKSNNNITIVQQSVGSRLLVVLEPDRENLAPGLTGGDVIRFDISLNGYTRASANSIPNSEVFGIVEKRNSDGSLNVVTYGCIDLPSTKILDLTGFNYGGNDIYFLSADNPGYIQNLPPSQIGQIIKPVYQIAPSTNATGTVVNYIGYVIQE